MANTLTGLIQYIYDSVDVVSRELVGLIPSVYINPKAEQAAKNQDISYDIVPDATAYDVTPANTIPALDSSTVAAGTMKINKVRGVKFHWTGEDEAAVGRDAKAGIQNNKIAQAFRTLCGEMEDDLAVLYNAASRAFGTAGTTPFGTAGDFSDAAEVARILKDNGAPSSELRLVIDTAAGAKILGKQSQVHMGGSTDPLRRGILLDIHGFQIRESAKIKAHTKGTGSGYLVNNVSGEAIGETSIVVDTGTGTILAGDILTNSETGRDTNKYVVGTALASGSLAINKPGLRKAWVDNDAVAVDNSYVANMAFARSAIHLLTRLPKMPEGGDVADDVMVIEDPHSGIFFQVALYRAYRSVLIEVAVAWGVKAAKSEHMALLLG
ncbi:MAG: P22 coat - protein 5 family protein [Nitrospinae bacterium]|nr:P22 coat - protein 5 family protein [Nitrospinota bacterium]